MALQLGELSIALELDNDRLRAGMAAAKKELEGLPPVARREMVKVSRVMDEEGGKSGGLLARGINSGLMRNSPLIVAGVGAALAAGAPVMMAAAGALFAGVGAAAAAQTVEVRSAWTDLGHDIRDGAVADAAVLVPVYTEMADQIGFAFQRLRPQLREAFAGSAPLIQSVTGGVIALAENAMPGLVRAVSSAGPVFAGLERFLAATGTGLSDFFDAINGHAPAAGSVFSSLGDIMGDLLPIIGELLGQGAELAADVLPAIAASTGLTLDVLQLLGPILPSVVAGFVAFKAAKAAAGYLQTFAVQAQFATMAATGSMNAGIKVGGAMSKVADGVGKTSAALPALGIVLAGIASDMSEAEAGTNSWAQAILAGGAAAAAAREQYANDDYLLRGLDEWTGLASSMGDAEQQAKDLYNAMTPLQQAQQDVTTATNELSYAIDEYGPGSSQAAAAADVLTAAERELERQNAATELAINGVTSAMIEQGEQALASVDSGFAYRKSLDDLEDAQAALNEAYASGSAEDQQRMQLALEEQTYNTALAFGQQQADLSGLSEDSLEYKRIIQEQMLGKLHELQAAAGPEMKAAIGQQIAALEASGVSLTGTATTAAATAQQMRDLGLSVTEVPGSKTVFIDAPTADQKRRLEELGLVTRTLPDGRIYVTADTSPAEGTLAAFMNQRRTIQLQAIVSTGAARTALGGLSNNSGFQERAAGGPVWPGQTFLVGEKGPELVQFAGSGNVLPADKTASVLAQSRAAVPSSAAAPAIAPAGGPLFHAETVNVIEGSPRDIAQELAYLARAKGWG